MRVWRFLRSLWWVRSFGLTWHNVRACWLQSDPDWLAKLPRVDLTDEEWDRFIEALES